MDDFQIQVLENQESLMQGQESVIEHVYGIVDIGSSVKDINDLQLEQLVLQTHIEFIILCALLLGLGIWLFNWGVTLWKRWWL